MKASILKPLRLSVYGAVLATFILVSACSKTSPPTPPSTPAMTPTPTVPDTSTSTPAMVVGSDVTATLGGSSEVPSVNGSGMGTMEARLDPATSILKWSVSYSGLTGAATSAHFHGPAIAGENAPPIVPVDGNLASPIVGVTTLTATQMADVKSGKWYFNIHTAANPNGEIRGQLMVKP
jgi:hypothetical protein